MITAYVLPEEDTYTIYLTKELAQKKLNNIFNEYRKKIKKDSVMNIELEWIDDDAFYCTFKNDIGQIEFERKFIIETVDIIETLEDLEKNDDK